MYPPGSDTLEAVKLLHSVAAIAFFAGVVACDTILHLIEDRAELTRLVAWKGRSIWNLKVFPAYKGNLGLKSLLKLQSLLWFGIAIGLEFVALWYGQRVDELANVEIIESRKQTVRSLRLASEANERANILAKEVLELQEKLAPRRLSELQQHRIASALALFKGQGINLFVYEAPEEIMNFGSGIERALGEKGAGWIVSKSWGYEKDRAVSGVLVEIIPIADPSSRAASTALVNALRRERVVVVGPVVEPFSNVGGRKGVQGNNAVRITVGIRP